MTLGESDKCVIWWRDKDGCETMKGNRNHHFENMNNDIIDTTRLTQKNKWSSGGEN